MYCSKRCKLSAWKAANPERWAHLERRCKKPYQRTVSAYYAGYCSDCGAAMGARHKRTRCDACALEARRREASEAHLAAALKKHAAAGRIVACKVCHVDFCPLYGAKMRAICSPSCAKVLVRAAKRITSRRRHARKRGVHAERVDPIKVFERDRWRCHLCGIKTPKSLRGTHHDNAPELEHIVPLSKGGPHTYANTACACRKCNHEKGDKPLGQLLLIG